MSEQGWRNFLLVIKHPQSINKGELQNPMGHRASQECEIQHLLEEASAEKVTSKPQMWVLTWRTLGSEILWGHKCKAWIRRGFSRAAGAWTSPGMTRTGVFETGTWPHRKCRWQSSWSDADTSILLCFFALCTHFLRGNCVFLRTHSQLPPSSQSICGSPASCLCLTPAAPREEQLHLSVKRALMACSPSPEPPDCTLQALIN